jgi:hypothetical protein
VQVCKSEREFMRSVPCYLVAIGLSLMLCTTLANPAVNTLYTFSAFAPGSSVNGSNLGSLSGTTIEGGT